jgi:uncharacterized protein (DUF885 family)
MTTARSLADHYHEEWLDAHPFFASELGIPGRDDRVPDDSEEGESRRRAQVEAVLADARRLRDAQLSPDDTITLGAVVSAAEQELSELDLARAEFTVTPMPFVGPASLLAVAARTILPDAQAAENYLARLRHSGVWIDQLTERLRAGAAKGRLPVAHLSEAAIAWTSTIVALPVPEALRAPHPPQGWDGAATWVAERDAVAEEVVRPALIRWSDQARDLLPRSRSTGEVGLVHLPGGSADYDRAILVHTTLPLTAEDLHRIGLEEVDRLEERCRRLGAELGLDTLDAVHRALRESSAGADPGDAITAAVAAVRRAEHAAAGFFPAPLPPACDVAPMPPVVAESGMAPHYTPPRLDGTRAGTYWFNTARPTAGTGWDLEGVAFHEAVPGHHLQLSRIQQLTELPDFQRQRSITVFSEGWGLYAEQLAEEMGLYSDNRALLGATSNALMRGARLVVDTGLHAHGWSRDRALEYYTAHVPMPEAFLANEIDRYIVWPGQALAYLTGKREVLRLREEAERSLGSAFSLPQFHAAVLDHGSLPMMVLEQSLRFWMGDAAN